MDKTVRVCSIDNEAERDLLCSVMDEQGIPYTLKKMEDGAYDGLYTSQGPWAFIESTVEYADSINQIVKDLRESHPTKIGLSADIPERKKESVAWKIEVAIFVLLLGAVTILIVRNVGLRKEIGHYSSGTLLSWKWMPSEKAMFGTMKETGQLRVSYGEKPPRLQTKASAGLRDIDRIGSNRKDRGAAS